ncbi:Putative disease resistance protein RGA4 [Dendrobium catenatum]|uniref:Disease resistance protein RGA4 n=1 Tax=Dendrobium catenatum TaxID=906689 RepID=A0A2I0W2H8_9ASPA|nr:Putative disease resistance protein RGA4 [Dendrobium catenatum]
MAMVLAAFVKILAGLLTDYVAEEGAILVGVKDELQKLQEQMMNIQCLLKDAERRKFDSSSIKLWLSQLKDVMYDADDIIDLCRIESHKLQADQNPESNISPVCCNFSSFFCCLVSVPLRHQIGNEIKEINKMLKRIYKNRKQFNLESLTESETQVPDDSRLTSSMASPSDVGREIDDAARRLVNRLVGENVDEKCRIFAVTGMGGIGKTTIAQKFFNYPKIQTFFNLKLWVCVSQNQSGIESLKQVISGVDRRCRDDSNKTELQGIVRDSIAAGKSLFLVLDNLWTTSVWVNWIGIPLI